MTMEISTERGERGRLPSAEPEKRKVRGSTPAPAHHPDQAKRRNVTARQCPLITLFRLPAVARGSHGTAGGSASDLTTRIPVGAGSLIATCSSARWRRGRRFPRTARPSRRRTGATAVLARGRLRVRGGPRFRDHLTAALLATGR